ncbi:GDSL-type esterase/lipase family protein [Nafulsella turpanensis]|uniref:GDSL-type esterase/lipase family protein n=1 Tax=Nafulsella turpanensis TaxID=1265690 RepID=UPI000373DA85|nr:GDSL-type esterase/lipase family protein [Nafulsella turpanensis]
MKFLITLVAVFFLLQACGDMDSSELGPKRFEETVQQFEALDKKSPPEEGAILFVGSSSIAHWNTLADDFPEERILNRGMGGSEFSDLLYYDNRLIYSYKPSRIFVYEGDNDLWYDEKPGDILNEAKELRQRIAEELPGVPVVFISVKPSVARWEMKEQYEEFNSLLKEYAEETPLTLFADIWTPMLNKEGEVYKHIFKKDKLHMNEQGYKVWQSVLAPYVKGEISD